jgi:hypothetical protein
VVAGMGYFFIFFNISFIFSLSSGIANHIPSELFIMAVFIQIISQAVSIRGHPEFHGFMLASV